jgi:alpha-N-arabinofuranosidase
MAQHTLTVQVDKPGTKVQPTMWGIFFEDINFAADGGVYAELVKNRSFEFLWPLMGWEITKDDNAVGDFLVINRGNENPNNPRFLRLTAKTDSVSYGLINDGFRGMGVKKDNLYDFSIIARKHTGDVKLIIELIDTVGAVLGQTSLENFSGKWTKHTAEFTCSETYPKARLRIFLEGTGSLDMDMISLFPRDTWKNRRNGLRADLVQMLADMKPGFLRSPGGCVVEGHHLDLRYQWKKTVGKLEDRKMIINRWNTEFPYRPAPDYFQSYGLGFYEYFLLSEDLGAEPLPILNCGMACQFNTAEVVPLDQLDPYIQDALDLIEFANGATTTKWGGLRAEMGHPEPFNLKYLGIGNEQWGEQYVERYKIIATAVRKAYPEIRLITGSGPFRAGELFDYLWGEIKHMDTDLVDEHYYSPPEWFLKNANRYDSYDRKGPKVFAGEFAAHGKENDDPTSRNTWYSAMCEAAYMTGLERNADVVYMASYAPLFANVEAWQWRPDLIWFDNLQAMGTPNYYVQKMYSTNRGAHVVPILEKGQALIGQDSLYASATIDEASKEVCLKIVNIQTKPMTVNINLEGAEPSQKEAVVQVLTAENVMDYNTIENPKKVYPIEKILNISGNKFEMALDKESFTVLKIKYK